jgi:putative selenate reductase
VIALNLVKKFREHQREPIPVSFSGGLDASNVARAVAMNFVPVTTCTDLLRPGGYGRMIRYLENLGAAMRKLGVRNIGDFVVGHALACPASPEEVNAAGLRNTPLLVAEATADPKYGWERNKGVPRKIGSKLWLYDCITCDKCVPVCPNDANFVYETGAVDIAYDNFELGAGGLRAIPGGVLHVAKARQFANYADACNECGNCDIFCPEDGGPFVEKPRFFGSLESFQRDAGRNGFYLDYERNAIHGVLAGEGYVLTVDRAANRANFERTDAAIEIRLSDNRALRWTPRNGLAGPRTLDLLPYLKLKLLLDSISDPRHANFANASALPHGNQLHD